MVSLKEVEFKTSNVIKIIKDVGGNIDYKCLYNKELVKYWYNTLRLIKRFSYL